MNKSIYDKISHQQLKLPLLIMEKDIMRVLKNIWQEHKLNKLEISYS